MIILNITVAGKQAPWSGKERRKQRAKTSEETRRGGPVLFPSLRSARSARRFIFVLLPHCRACLQANITGTTQLEERLTGLAEKT